MYKAKDRIESAERALVRIDLKASRKYLKVCVVKVPPFRASNHFLIMPEHPY